MVTVLKRSRPAIAMIELIFAIVVMGIVMLSIPMLLNQSRQSSYVGFQQESIAAAASQLSMLLTHHWDESDTNPMIGVPILEVSDGFGQLDETNVSGLGTGLRRGMPVSSSRTFRQNIGGRSSANDIGADVNETPTAGYDDVDDYHNYPIILRQVIASTVGDYMDTQITMRATVTYAEDNLSLPTGYDRWQIYLKDPVDVVGQHTNIKHVVLNLTTATPDSEMSKAIRMEAITCNIGGYDLNERSY